MSISTRKFSEFITANLNATNKTVGLSGGANAIFDVPTSWTTAGRPTMPGNGQLGFNTTLQQYEFYDTVAAAWTQLEDSNDIATLLALLASHVAGEGASLIGLEGSGTVQDFSEPPFYISTASPFAPNAIVFDPADYLPLAGGTMAGVIDMDGNQITGAPAPVANSDLANKLYVDSAVGGSVTPGLINELAYYAAAGSTISGLTTANDGLLVTDAVGEPSISSNIPTAVTIGGAYIYRVGGNDVALADGGTGASLVAANGAIPYSTAAELALLAPGSAGQLFQSGGAGAPNWTTATYPATSGALGNVLKSDGANWVSGADTPGALTQNQIYVGDASNVAQDVAMSGDATIVASGALTIANNAVSNAKLAQMPMLTLKGNNTGGASDPLDLTVAEVNTMLGTTTAGALTGLSYLLIGA